ncbi:RcnB family protein [Phenylobacterium immobile]|uniref:RcnB family protein n=1 Tax=Phenylobacterium immobile TaxID=21 RepID=UPI000AA749D2|nr:RcnB family protein [Phenylobacterium immobile]
MKRLMTAAAAVLILSGSAASAFAAPRHDDQRYDQRDDRRMNGRHDNGRHNGWRKGGRIERADWNRGQRIDYRRHHLAAPRRGYEWRQVDGNYILAAAATGVIVSIILANH